MKDAEDEAFDELSRKQGMWGGGFQAKRAMAKARIDDDDDIQVYKRPWVGLTDEEKDGKRVLENGLLFNSAEVQVWELAVDWAEAKLKEKNA